jgi:hypothetical protein
LRLLNDFAPFNWRPSFYPHLLVSNLVCHLVALHAVLAVHFRAHGASSKVYQESVMICCASGFKSHHLPSSGAVDAEDKFEKGNYSCETLLSLARILMRLVVHGNFKHSHIVPCAAFLRSCIRLQDATIELESLYGTIDTILSAIIPALDPHNDSPLHVCMLPRAAYDLMSQFRGLELLRIEADGMEIENVVASLGWCSRRHSCRARPYLWSSS